VLVEFEELRAILPFSLSPEDEHKVDGGHSEVEIACQVLEEEDELLPIRGLGQHMVELLRGSRNCSYYYLFYYY